MSSPASASAPPEPPASRNDPTPSPSSTEPIETDGDDGGGGENRTPASHENHRERHADADVRIAGAGSEADDHVTPASTSKAQAILLPIPQFDTPRPVEQHDGDRLRNLAAINLQARSVGKSLVTSDDGGGGGGEGQGTLRARLRSYGLLEPSEWRFMMLDRTPAGRDPRVGRDDLERDGHGRDAVLGDENGGRGGTDRASVLWNSVGVTSATQDRLHTTAAQELPGGLRPPYFVSPRRLPGGEAHWSIVKRMSRFARPAMHILERLLETADPAAPATSSTSAGLDYTSALTRLAVASSSLETPETGQSVDTDSDACDRAPDSLEAILASLSGVLPPVDELLTKLTPDLLYSEDTQPINLTARKDPDIGIGNHGLRLRRLIKMLGQELMGEARGSTQIGIAIAFCIRGLPAQVMRECVVHSELVSHSGRAEPAKVDDTPPREPGAHDARSGPIHSVGEAEDGKTDVNFTPLRDFILGSNAYASFMTRLLMSTHEPYRLRVEEAVGDSAIGEEGKMFHPEDIKIVVEELSWVPTHLLTFMERHSFRLPLADRLKAFVEDHTTEGGSWSPLNPRVHMLEEGFCRLQWSSPCGASRHLDVPQHARKRLKTAFDSAPAFLEPAPVPSAAIMKQRNDRSDSSRILRPFRHFLSFGRSLSKRPSPQIIYSSVALNTSLKQDLRKPPQAVIRTDSKPYLPEPPTAAQNSLQSFESLHQTPSSDARQTTAIPLAKDDDPQAPADETQYLYLCIQRGRHIFKTIECKPPHTDAVLFAELNSTYDQARGFKRRWLSVWRFDHCEFYEFHKFTARHASPLGCRFPNSNDDSYAFEPRPPRHLPPDGPVSAGEFRDRYYHVARTFWVPGRHRHPSEEELEKGEKAGNAALKALPKKKTQLAMDDDAREDFFGLLAVEVISYSRVLVYALLVIAACLGFLGWWLSKHQNDLQNAAVPVGIFLAVIAIVVALLNKGL